MIRTVTVEGVLDSAPGGCSRNDQEWELVFHLMPWKRLDDSGALPTKPLRVEIPMTRRALDGWMRKLITGTTVRVSVDRIRINELWWFGKAKRGPTKIRLSARLAQAAAARSRKVVVTDSILGKLTLDRSMSWYEGRASLWGMKARVAVAQSGSDENVKRDASDIASAATAFATLGKLRVPVKRALVAKLLPLYNDTWRDRRPAITADRLLRRLRVEQVVLSRRRTTLYFKDGGLFLGHAVEVRLTSRGAVSEICLAG